MGQATEQHARIEQAFERPTLRLLSRKWAPAALTVFSAVFSHEDRFIPADDLHVRVERLIRNLREASIEVPDGTGRDLCRSWVAQEWLIRDAPDTDPTAERYSLTSHAVAALEYVDRLADERAVLSESSVQTFVDSLRRLAVVADPSLERNLARLDREIARLQQQRDALAAGDDAPSTDTEVVLNGFLNVLSLRDGLLGDLLDAAEAEGRHHVRLRKALRAETRPSGEVLAAYMEAEREARLGTREGRAVEGALTVLRDPQTVRDLEDSVQTVLDNPASETLMPGEVSELRATVATLMNHVNDVLRRRHRTTNAVSQYMPQADPDAKRRLDQIVRDIDGLLSTWVKQTGPRERMPIPGLPQRPDVATLRTRIYQDGGTSTPPPLQDRSDDDVPPLNLYDLRGAGGPQTSALRSALDAAAVNGDVDLGRFFSDLPDHLRRPVEVLGLIQIVAEHLDDETVEHRPTTFETIRPDGTRRTFRANVPTYPGGTRVDR